MQLIQEACAKYEFNALSVLWLNAKEIHPDKKSTDESSVPDSLAANMATLEAACTNQQRPTLVLVVVNKKITLSFFVVLCAA